MDELIDILNPDLTVQKTCLKSYAHMYGLLHASVHIWFYNANDELLFQKRSKNKIAFPNLWDVSVAGHIDAGEKAITAAVRETKEEIGLIINKNDLTCIGDFEENFKHNDYFIDNEIHYIYVSELKSSLSELRIQKEELSDLKLVKLDWFEELIKKEGFEKKYVPHYKEYYKLILTEIKKRLHKKNPL